MLVNSFTIEQTLHGYSNGHHLLASSCTLSENSHKIMTILSDLSGPGLVSGFEEYITGYPLPNDRMYAFSKTWYASEMKRPGCVWTHTLLVNNYYLDDLNFFTLLSSFTRPDINALDINKYNMSIQFDNTNNQINLNNISIDKLKLLEWSLLSNNKPIIIPALSSVEFLNETLLFLQNELPYLYNSFSFCTGSLASRMYEKKVFDLQITPVNLSRNIARSKADITIVDIFDNYAYPEWVDIISLEAIGLSNKSFNDFVDTFKSIVPCDRNLLGKIADLYTSFRTFDQDANVSSLFKLIKESFDKEISDKIIIEVVKGVLQNDNIQWFRYKKSIQNIVDISTIEMDINISIALINSYLTNVRILYLNYSNSEIKKLLFLFIENDINLLGEFILKNICNKISADMLPYYSDMDIKACSVLVNANNRLAVCKDIWKENCNFQKEILSCIDGQNIEDSLSKEIINIILNTTKEVLYKQIYMTFGNKAILIVLSWYFNNSNSYYNRNSKWLRIGAYNVDITMEWLLSIELHNPDAFCDLIIALNPYSDDILKYGKSSWEKLLSKMDISQLDSNKRLSLSLFLFPILSLTKGKFSPEIALFIFDNINNSLIYHKLDYDSWEKIDKLLPEIPWYRSWDKCKRLRRAFQEKGYHFKSFYFD